MNMLYLLSPLMLFFLTSFSITNLVSLNLLWYSKILIKLYFQNSYDKWDCITLIKQCISMGLHNVFSCLEQLKKSSCKLVRMSIVLVIGWLLKKVPLLKYISHIRHFTIIVVTIVKVTYLREPIVSKALERKLREWTIVNTLEALDSKFMLTKALTKL